MTKRKYLWPLRQVAYVDTQVQGFVTLLAVLAKRNPFNLPFLLSRGALDPTASVTQCDDPCDVTLSHTYTLRGSPTPTLQENSKQGAEGPQRTPSQKQRTITNNVHRK